MQDPGANEYKIIQRLVGLTTILGSISLSIHQHCYSSAMFVIADCQIA